MYINPDYKETDYRKEYREYFRSKDPLRQLSLNFVIRFWEKTPTLEFLQNHFSPEDIESLGFEGLVWGYALTGKFNDHLEEGNEVIKWKSFYEHSFGGRLETFASSVTQILDYL